MFDYSIRSPLPGSRRSQWGGVALFVVIIMTFAMLVSILFANRTLVFEQKTSANQYRATLALEAAEAGLEWGTAMLNRGAKINASCANSTVSTDTRFFDRYLTIDPTTGALTAKAGTIHAACVGTQTGTGWNCSCPVPGAGPDPTVPTVTSGVLPSFAIAFVASPTTGTLQLVSYGCTSGITTTVCSGDAAATVRIALGSFSSVITPPAAPLTVKGSVSIGNAALTVVNSDPTANGITVDAGLGVDADKLRIFTVPGTPPWTTVISHDQSLSTPTADQMFASYFGLTKDAYRNLASVTQLTCPCTSADLTAAYTLGARQLWLNGNLTVTGGPTIGSEADPLLIIVDGSVDLQGTAVISGMVYSTASWNSIGGADVTIKGAAVTEGDYAGNGHPTYYYSPVVFSGLRNTLSMIRIPGSWRDF